MKNIKSPDKKPFYVYLIIVVAVMTVLNLFILPSFRNMNIQKVDYSTFLTMVDKKQIAAAEIRKNEIIFTRR